jgi:hypothetical protein
MKEYAVHSAALNQSKFKKNGEITIENKQHQKPAKTGL